MIVTTFIAKIVNLMPSHSGSDPMECKRNKFCFSFFMLSVLLESIIFGFILN